MVFIVPPSLSSSQIYVIALLQKHISWVQKIVSGAGKFWYLTAIFNLKGTCDKFGINWPKHGS